MMQLTNLRECPICGTGALQPLLGVTLKGEPHGEKDHNYSFTERGLDLCNACGHAVLESYSHDCWSHGEDWDMYWWYVLLPADVVRLQALLAPCPAPLSPTCACAVHVSLHESSERLYGGVRSQTYATRKVPYAWIQLELGEGAPRFKSLR